MIEPEQYKRWREEIRYCRSPEALEQWVQRVVAPTGFGSNSLAETEEPIGLDYQEIAECLQETDRSYFEQEIELLRLAQLQLRVIESGSVPEKPVPANPWEMFM